MVVIKGGKSGGGRVLGDDNGLTQDVSHVVTTSKKTAITGGLLLMCGVARPIRWPALPSSEACLCVFAPIQASALRQRRPFGQLWFGVLSASESR